MPKSFEQLFENKGNKSVGLIDNWLRHIKDVYRLHNEELDAIEDS